MFCGTLNTHALITTNFINNIDSIYQRITNVLVTISHVEIKKWIRFSMWLQCALWNKPRSFIERMHHDICLISIIQMTYQREDLILVCDTCSNCSDLLNIFYQSSRIPMKNGIFWNNKSNLMSCRNFSIWIHNQSESYHFGKAVWHYSNFHIIFLFYGLVFCIRGSNAKGIRKKFILRSWISACKYVAFRDASTKGQICSNSRWTQFYHWKKYVFKPVKNL